jgi:nucleotide-binding universal stress UspA family protein
MFERVIWATDGSKAADHALPVVRELAQVDSGEVLVVHVMERTLPGRTGGGGFPVHADEQELLEKIEGQVRELTSDGLSATLRKGTAPVGGAAQTIAEAASEFGAGAIVMGTRGHSAITGFVLGNTAQRLLHMAHCPVLAVPPAET